MTIEYQIGYEKGTFWAIETRFPAKLSQESPPWKCRVPSADRFDLLDLPIDSLRSGVGLFMTKGITHALEVSLEGLGYLHDLFYGRRLCIQMKLPPIQIDVAHLGVDFSG